MNIMTERYKVERDGRGRRRRTKLKEEEGSRRVWAGRGEETEESGNRKEGIIGNENGV